MVFRFSTNGGSWIVKLGIETSKNTNINIIAVDPNNTGRVFMNRYCTVLGNQTYYVKMPLTSTYTDIIVFSPEEGNNNDSKLFKITNIAARTPVKQTFVVDDKTRKFIDFAQKFCFDFSNIGNGTFKDKDSLFEFRVYSTLPDTRTPARIEKTHSFVEISRKYFDNMTVPERLIILLHEYCHNFMNNDSENEVESDQIALRIYQNLGYPKIEAVYAFTQILQESSLSNERLDTLMYNLSN